MLNKGRFVNSHKKNNSPYTKAGDEMKVKEFDIGSAHIEFYDDNCVNQEQSDAIYKGLSKYLLHIKKDTQAEQSKVSQVDSCSNLSTKL